MGSTVFTALFMLLGILIVLENLGHITAGSLSPMHAKEVHTDNNDI